ncbi:Uncharacterised protein [Providencia rustigianii]|nr:Uncharacterised protein [Providencia rustigianii]
MAPFFVYFTLRINIAASNGLIANRANNQTEACCAPTNPPGLIKPLLLTTTPTSAADSAVAYS